MKTVRLVGGYLRHNMMSTMAYRGAFLIQMFGMMLNNTMLLFFWWVLFRQVPGMHGWQFTEIVMLYSIAAMGYGVAGIVCGNASSMARTIATGDLDYYLALPADPLVHLLVSRMSLPAWGDMLFGLIVFMVAAPNRWPNLPLFLLLGLLTALIFVAFRVIVGSLAFWIGNAQSLALQMNNALITFSLYPAEIFPGLVRVLLYTLIPAAFIGTVPVKLLKEFSWGKLALLAAFAAGLTLLAQVVFRLGLRRYESGNLVTVRG